MTTSRRALLAATAATLATPRIAPAQQAPGVTANEIRIGSTNALSGPASSYSVISRALTAVFKRQNDQGGIAGRQINFIVYDDGYQPPRTLEQTRRLVEQDRVAFLFNQLGTPTNSAIHRYVNQRKIPHLFLATGADKWANPKEYPGPSAGSPATAPRRRSMPSTSWNRSRMRRSRCSTRMMISARITSTACATCSARASTPW
ncbi:ABC transporter substrate-binding protein [Siccirubricoccus deserti]